MSAGQFNIRRFENPLEFASLTNPFLLDHEAENCFFIGHLPTLTNPTDVHLYALADAGGAVTGVALMTPGRHLVMTRAPAQAAVALAQYLDRVGIKPPGIQGPGDVVEAFVGEWQTLTGAVAQSSVGMAVHEAKRIVPPPRPAAGRMRTARADDADLLTQWAVEFGREINEPHLAGDARAITECRIGKVQLVLWEDNGQPVAMAGSAGATPNGIRINAVFTPPPFRNRGYATTLVATLSRQLLGAGRQFCFLYTDLANPTSNKIYHSIGYEPVAKTLRVQFDPPAAAR